MSRNKINEIIEKYFERKVTTTCLSYMVTSCVKKVLYMLVNVRPLGPQDNGRRNEICVRGDCSNFGGQRKG